MKQQVDHNICTTRKRIGPASLRVGVTVVLTWCHNDGLVAAKCKANCGTRVMNTADCRRVIEESRQTREVIDGPTVDCITTTQTKLANCRAKPSASCHNWLAFASKLE